MLSHSRTRSYSLFNSGDKDWYCGRKGTRVLGPRARAYVRPMSSIGKKRVTTPRASGPIDARVNRPLEDVPDDGNLEPTAVALDDDDDDDDDDVTVEGESKVLPSYLVEVKVRGVVDEEEEDVDDDEGVVSNECSRGKVGDGVGISVAKDNEYDGVEDKGLYVGTLLLWRFIGLMNWPAFFPLERQPPSLRQQHQNLSTSSTGRFHFPNGFIARERERGLLLPHCH